MSQVEVDLATQPIFDVDSHVAEAPDLWTSRTPAKWADAVPQVRTDANGVEEWWAGDTKMHAVGAMALAGWRDYQSNPPPTHADMDPGAFDPRARLERLDEYGVQAQVLFPNILGFSAHTILKMHDPDLRIFCVQAYNDFLVEFAEADPARLIPLMFLPFWDTEASLREMARAHELGHRGIVFASEFEKVGFPRLADSHWDPILAAAQERGLSMNFHAGFGAVGEGDIAKLLDRDHFNTANLAKTSALFHIGNFKAIADVIMDGICRRFPRLRFVSIESGFGYLPFLLESLDWQWHNSGAGKEQPNEPLPSEIFRRQVYGAFWHERSSLSLLPLLADNVMFETDYPHPTSLSPGPASIATDARSWVQESFADVPGDVARKVLWDNAAQVYGVTSPVPTGGTA